MQNPERNLKIIETFKVPNLGKKTRLQDLAHGMFQHIPTKSGVKKALKNKLVKINGISVHSGTFLLGGELIELYQSNAKKNKPKIDIQLEVIFEDDYLALINKPAGITVSGNKNWTLENALSSHLKKSTQPDTLLNPEPIHRLDHATSGILLIGKTASLVIKLNKLFENRNIQKIYFAVSIGKMPPKGQIETPIDEKVSSTKYKVLATEVSEKFDFLNLVALYPKTGRKHQIRRHLSSIGHPILGDSIYCEKDKLLKGNGLYLHAVSLEFIHPITKENLLFKATITKKFQRLFPSFRF
jgi:23S rRNA pseudouridine1911/1915/1917 synthase